MNIERVVRIFAGLVVLLTLGLGVEGSPIFQNPNWLWFTAFVGFNLAQSGVTRFCPLDIILKKAGLPSGGVCS